MASGGTHPPVQGDNIVHNLSGPHLPPHSATPPQYLSTVSSEFTSFRNIDLGPDYGARQEKGPPVEGPALPPYSYNKENFAPPTYEAVGGAAIGPQPILMQPGMELGQPYAYYNYQGPAGAGFGQDRVVVEAMDRRQDPITPSPIIALTLGILSVLCCCFFCGIPAIVLGAIVMGAPRDNNDRSDHNRKRLNVMSSIGLGLGTLGVFSSLIWIFIFFFD